MFQLASQLPADPCEVSLNLSRASQSCLNMRKHILSSYVFQKVRARDELRRLIARATKQKRLACFMQAIGELLKSVDTGRVERSRIPKAQYHHVSKLPQVFSSFRELLGRSEEKRAMNAENGHVRGNVLVLQDVRLPILQVFARDRRDGCRSVMR